MARSRITSFIVKGSYYFTAHLDNGDVRVGLVNATCYDLPPTHPRYAEAVEAADEAAVETLHDDLTGVYLCR